MEYDNRAPWRRKLHEIIFEADTFAGKVFDIVLILAILVSVLVVVMESVGAVRSEHGMALRYVEWIFTILFTIEYILRILTVEQPRKYALSFFGIVDVLAVLPTYISLFVAGTHYFLVIRTLRILRVFRVLKLVQYLNEATVLMQALRSSRRKIAVFIYTVLIVVLIVGSMMYMIEGEASGFTSIPRSVYWAIVTLTTVGYGDIAPITPVGQTLAAFLMILGYGIIAVPTGIVTAELNREMKKVVTTGACPQCSHEGHDADAAYCKFCGAHLS